MKYTLIKVSDNKSDDGTMTFNYQDQSGCHYDSPKNWLYTGIMSGCGCGSSEEIEELAYEVLKHFATPHMERPNFWDDIKYEIIAQWLDSVDMLEHGTSVYGSWLSDKGKEVWECIK